MAEYKIFLSACEASAEKHCLELMSSVKDLAAEEDCQISFSGIGGSRMRQAGCNLIADTVSRAAMIYNAFGQIGYYRKLLKEIQCFFKENPQDVVVVCDSPAFNFHVAKAAKKAGAKVVFYVAPQLWAWAPWRIRKLKKRCDKLACILPFEPEWFAARGVEAEFVGNPLFDEIDFDSRRAVKSYDGYEPQSAKVALLPGSREAEIKTLWKPMQLIAAKLKTDYSNIKFTTVAVDSGKLEMLKADEISGFECDYRVNELINTCRESDYAFAASGSASLQVAATACPMTVMYQSSKLLWHLIGKWLINIDNLSLVNILAGKELVPEYMPYFNSIDPIAEQASRLLSDKAALEETSRALAELVSPLGKSNASRKTAKIVLQTAKS